MLLSIFNIKAGGPFHWSLFAYFRKYMYVMLFGGGGGGASAA